MTEKQNRGTNKSMPEVSDPIYSRFSSLEGKMILGTMLVGGGSRNVVASSLDCYKVHFLTYTLVKDMNIFITPFPSRIHRLLL